MKKWLRALKKQVSVAPKIVTIHLKEERPLNDPNDRVLVFETNFGDHEELTVGLFESRFVESIKQAQKRRLIRKT